MGNLPHRSNASLSACREDQNGFPEYHERMFSDQVLKPGHFSPWEKEWGKHIQPGKKCHRTALMDLQ